MFEKILNTYKNFDKMTLKILKHGLEFCFTLCIISVVVLLTYNFIIHSSIIFNIGFNLFKLSLIFGAEFIMCGFITDKIKKQMI